MSQTLSFLLLLAAPLFGQVGAGMLTGKIVDETSSAIPRADVKVINESSGSTVALSTNNDGIYRASALLPGTYRIEVHAVGFDPQVRTNVVLEVAQTLAVDVALKVGQQNLTVEVSVRRRPSRPKPPASASLSLTRRSRPFRCPIAPPRRWSTCRLE